MIIPILKVLDRGETAFPTHRRMESPSSHTAAFSAAREIIRTLLASATRRCRLSNGLCRLTVSLQKIEASDSAYIKISVSDTGIGSTLEEFQAMEYSPGWDGILLITTTCIGDKEVFQYQLNLLEPIGTSRRLTRLHSLPKNGRKFSGTEVAISMPAYEGLDELANWIVGIIRKVSILRIPNIAFQLKCDGIDLAGSNYEIFPLELHSLQPPESTNIEHLPSCLKDYITRHEDMMKSECQSCFLSGEDLMIGSGIASNTRKGQTLEVAIAIARTSDSSQGTCPWKSSMKNEILYFNNYSIDPVPGSVWQVLESACWEKYGLGLGRDPLNGFITLKPDSLASSTKIIIAIHSYLKVLERRVNQPDKNLVKKALKIGFEDLKAKHRGFFLSSRALKIQKHVPDLSRALAGLIRTSNDRDFQNECALLLGLDPLDASLHSKLESSIRVKVNSLLSLNDGNNTFTKGHSLFADPDPPIS